MRKLEPARLATRCGRQAVVAALFGVATLGTPAPGVACDLCAVYTATELRESRTGLGLGVGEQYTYYGTWQQSGHEVSNPGERLASSITQLYVGYNITPRIGLQLNVPLIARPYRREQVQGLVDGKETGFGDLSLLGSFVAFSDVTEESVIRWTLLGGLKLPSGSPRRLEEELEENADAPPSGIHGHDLALGSGSTDGIIGTQAFFSWQRLFVTGAVQYVLRTEGAFDYTYANDLIWSGGPGVFALLAHDYTLRVQAWLTGETKGNDTLAGTKGDDTAITALYIGPAVQFTWGSSLAAELAASLPVLQNNSALQIVPNYRFLGGVTWRF